MDLLIKLKQTYLRLSNKRYQQCSKFHKFWRHRWKILVPFIFIYKWITKQKIYIDKNVNGKFVHTNEYEFACNKLIWSIASSYASEKMIYYWTQEEVDEKFEMYKKRNR